MPRRAPLTARASARRLYDVRGRGGTAGLQNLGAAPEMRLIRRALAAIARYDGDANRRDYVVTDVSIAPPSRARRRDVVFLEQQVLGLPVYGGRRSVIFASRRKLVTGTRLSVRPPSRLTPLKSAESAAIEAVRSVVGKRPKGDATTISAGPGPERMSVVSIDGLGAPVRLHLAVFGTGKSRLAWVATVSLPDGDGFEVVIDAVTGKPLRRRPTIDHAVACLDIKPEAGGPPAAAPLSLAFDPGWIDAPGRRFVCVDANEAPLALPGPDAQGDFCGTAATVFQQTLLNALALANVGLDLLVPFDGGVQARVSLMMLNSAIEDIDKIAAAKPDLVRPLLRFAARHPTRRHAASDPGVLLHELGHLVLCAGVGGSQVAAPFETEGESASVNEGLADFLGLTLWNSIRRSSFAPGGDVTIFGAWVFQADSRDYSRFLVPGAAVPTFPSSGSLHRRGMVLGVALLRARLAIEAATNATEADAVMWSTVCHSLAVMPHQGALPQFCCVSRALREVVPVAHQSRLTSALDDANIPDDCPHMDLI